MSIKIWTPTDFIADTGWNGRSYPIKDKPDDTEILYDNHIQDIAYIQANLAAVFNEWFLSFFRPEYFKFVRIKTQSTLADFKSFMKQIYKKDKPFLVIDPHMPEIVEDSIFAQNMLNRYNMIDPTHDHIGAKMIYALEVMKTDLMELHFRRNRWRMEFDIMIMERSMNQQTNTFNSILMNIRHNSKFMLVRNVPILIPFRHVMNIANFHGLDWQSEEFMKFMNAHSKYPIIKRFLANGRAQFYLDYELHIYVESPGFPSRDTPETSDAIELGARIVDQFYFTADLPSEYIFLTKREFVGKFDRHIDDDPDNVTFISPIYADMPRPTEIYGFVATNHIDVQVQEGEEPKLQIIPFIADYDKDICHTIEEYIHRGGNIDDLIKVRVYPNGSFVDVGCQLYKDGVVKILRPVPNKLYTICIYVNLKDVNLIREGKHKKFIGNIEKY